MDGGQAGRPVVEIIAVGDELLLGDVLDTNTHWLCRQIAERGGLVTRAVMVRDDPEALGRELKGVLSRGPDMLFMTGGLGPTGDDRTLEAIACALNRPLTAHARAVALVQERYDRLAAKGYVDHSGLTPSRRKMALLPQGSDPLANPVGAAPGVVLVEGETTIVALPGVPAELKGIFITSLQSLLVRMLGHQAWRQQSVRVQCGDESLLAPILQAVSRAHPKVYLKSLAQQFGPDQWLQVTLSASGPADAQAEERVVAAMGELTSRLGGAGIAFEKG